jgi:hypothetical protein
MSAALAADIFQVSSLKLQENVNGVVCARPEIILIGVIIVEGPNEREG